MRHVMVRYTTKPDRADDNVRLIGEVFDSLRKTATAGVTYAVYRMEDGVSFVHVASVEDGDNNPLTSLAAFKAFTADIKDRCEVPPATTKLTEVGRYTSQPVGAA